VCVVVAPDGAITTTTSATSTPPRTALRIDIAGLGVIGWLHIMPVALEGRVIATLTTPHARAAGDGAQRARAAARARTVTCYTPSAWAASTTPT
jgi:hypothetical protein